MDLGHITLSPSDLYAVCFCVSGESHQHIHMVKICYKYVVYWHCHCLGDDYFLNFASWKHMHLSSCYSII